MGRVTRQERPTADQSQEQTVLGADGSEGLMSLAYRPAEGRDLPLILDAWLSSFRTSNSAGIIAMKRWKPVMTPELLDILARRGVEAWVAYHPEADMGSDLYGFLIAEKDVSEMTPRGLVKTDQPLVHYVYVRLPYRRNGVARGLFRAAGVDPSKPFLYTFKTPTVANLSKKIPCASWRPLIARFSKEPEE